MTRKLTTWRIDRHGVVPKTSLAWIEAHYWCVIDISAGWGAVLVVEGPFSDQVTAMRRAQELQADDHAERRAKAKATS